jgi:putative peptidoglycan lipid II flippase
MTALRGVGTMAVGTVASRATGFLRTAVLVAVLGVQGVPLAFTVANTAPNIVYELLLGGILTSTVVPLLVRADKDGYGEAYAQRLLTLTVLVLGGTALVLVLLAPQIADLYLSSSVDADTRALTITFARFFLPQVLFYGVGALLGAWLNTHGRFGPPMWAPVLNNVVVIGSLVVFALLPGPDHLTSGSITDTQVAVLGIGVTLGIVAQTVALLPALRATGLRLVPRLDLRGTGLGQAGRLDVLRAQLDRGLRSTTALMVPAATALVVLGVPVATTVFGHGRTSLDQARFMGELLAVFACGLVAFSTYQLQLRAFYALQDTRTPALVNLVVNAVTVGVDVAVYLLVPDRWRVLGLAAGQASSYLVGVVVCTTVLARRVPRNTHGHVLRTATRCLFAVAAPAVAALLVARLADDALGTAFTGSLVATAAGGAVLLVGYVAIVRRLGVPEVDELVAPLLRAAQGRGATGRTREGE